MLSNSPKFKIGLWFCTPQSGALDEAPSPRNHGLMPFGGLRNQGGMTYAPLRLSMDALRQLEQLGLTEAAAWARRVGVRTFADVWKASPRGDWLVRIALEVDVDRIAIVRAAATCAAAAIRSRTEDDPRPERALRMAIRWTEGTASGADCWAAGFDANAAADVLLRKRSQHAARSAAAAAFACDWDADVAYYAERGHAAEAVVQAAPAIASSATDGHRVAVAIVRDAIPFRRVEAHLSAVLARSSFPPPLEESPRDQTSDGVPSSSAHGRLR